MKRLSLMLLCAVTMLSFGVSPSLGTVLPVLDLRELVSSADVIAVGSLSNTANEGRDVLMVAGQPVEGERLSATLHITRLLKGSASSRNLGLRFFAPTPYIGYRSISGGEFGLFFLRKEPNGQYGFVSPYYPYLIASADTPLFTGDSYDRVVHEVAYVLRSRSTLPAERKQAVAILTNVPSKRSTEALRVATLDGQEDVRLLAMAALLKRSDYSVLDRAADILLHAAPEETEDGSIRNLAFALGQVKDAAAVPALSTLLSSPSAVVRRNSAAALNRLASPEVIDPLIKALADPDQDVRYQAVSGLGKVTGQNEWWTSVDKYRTNEELYLSHWRDWANHR